jgi:predicted 2-oxoglutarate/Fe(II)-dependent dioxygenase YbiX
MPDSNFFRHLGVFAIEKFLDADLCHRIETEMSSIEAATPALVTKDGIDRVDEAIRRTKLIAVSTDLKVIIEDRLTKIEHQIEEHFQILLDDFEEPQFLAYKVGDFFKPHVDSSTSSDDHGYRKQRRVSVVLFINGESFDTDRDRKHNYCGGSLILYGLIDRPEWKDYGFNVQGKQGLLIAFAANTYHEVKPVIEGLRYTVVTWFFDRKSEKLDPKTIS